MKVVCGRASQHLGSRIADELDIDLIKVSYKTFPDGEQYLKLLDGLDEEVVVVQSITSDIEFVNLLLLLDAVGSSNTTTVIPYMGYSRQDRRFEEGEPVSARAIAKPISQESNRVITVDIHNEMVGDYFDCEFTNLMAFDHMAGELALDNPVVVAPDEGAIGRARSVAEIRGWEHDYLLKTRKSGEEVEIKPKKMDIDGRNVLIVDDIIATGGTMSQAIGMLKDQGAQDIYVSATHPVLAGNALQKLYSAGCTDIICTDTIEKSVSKVTVAPVIARSIK
ncbi:Phosphoribosylpyrophosphate synthetase PrsA [Methanonatronarchaeum thermophilum]|uniref:Ribose-phosphate pyrophosphokinase n=1 Tax=Methanonatronarchaeum thermophilum TaxID=1927129 RepID=A0A1Y3GDM8_9EURY|nr:ribose-phosphate diphosphokinase [Methanonatronarchaeum thermophilum]OUJ19360.1 Phosphoribosylpyrophosphate synthetase PrsA [Methanonatronarchaeum thermophilum]